MDLVFFGIQGSGKGTQAKRLASEFDYDIFEAGGELRKIAREDTQLGHTVKSFIDAGNLVPHEIIMQVVKEAIGKRSKDQKILFDGIPRDLDQMHGFDAIMKDAGREFRAIHFLLDPETGVQRILGRAKVEGRADDANEKVIRRRMKTFVEKTMPVIERYKKEGKMTEIEGNRGMEEVYEDLKRLVACRL
ncbi:nucleoside monophosphate kinase [Candidatus Peregrinibacteria bacterium]|nr:nucleoside monophosphate kinase [Candidatus Peregrinibacteria bacterium]MBI3815949.1 nucleoside monophosphate kinase [Candidatus Peregrinibacteria bacterium]